MGVEERLERIERLMLLNTKQALDTSEAALMLGISASRVRHLVSERNIPHYKQGRVTYFKKSEIEEWMLRHRVPTNDEVSRKAVTYVVTHKK